MSFLWPKRFCPRCGTPFAGLLPGASAARDSWWLGLLGGGGAEIVGWAGMIVAIAGGYAWGIAMGCLLGAVMLASIVALERHLTVYVCPRCGRKSRFAQLARHRARQGAKADGGP